MMAQRMHGKTHLPGVQKSALRSCPLACSVASGAVWHDVPTRVFLTLFLIMLPPVARNALTPKSVICTEPSSPRRMFPALTSLRIWPFLCRYSRPSSTSFSMVAMLASSSTPFKAAMMSTPEQGRVAPGFSVAAASSLVQFCMIFAVSNRAEVNLPHNTCLDNSTHFRDCKLTTLSSHLLGSMNTCLLLLMSFQVGDLPCYQSK
ncbi:hypothetical protein GDO78_013603 [Eleutherodactylus coqui]|uniref:Uncharacterized protein n=1 Tax=Eleutherodactylus coqui TaxID=57060 RepID=A0A8J6BLY3_ELECQ|nr:hypothetical protein GDO78_013603 [Eleutherodactylus coqui]